MLTEIAFHTYQAVDIATKDGRKFLQKVIRDNNAPVGRWGRGWSAYASGETDWKIEFRRNVEGEKGCPDVWVTVRTSETVRRSGKTGSHRTFSDAEPVYIPEPVRMSSTSNSRTNQIARALLDGHTVEIELSRGSTNSSQHGIGFIHLQISQQYPGGSVTLDTTTFVHGKCVCSGSVDCGR
jgi:hypothetical protein